MSPPTTDVALRHRTRELLTALLVASTAVGISACTRTVTGPDGRPALLIQCPVTESCLATARAKCNGAYHILSSTSRGGNTELLVECGNASSQFESDSESASDSVPESAESVVTEPTRPPPTGAAGFAFGSALDAAQTTCEEHAHAWTSTPDGGVCDGAPVDVGVNARVELGLCDGQLCRVTLVAVQSTTDDAVFANTARLKRAISNRYGAPTRNDAHIPSYCKKQLTKCLEQGLARVNVEWTWRSGQQIALSLAPGAGVASVIVSYRTQPAPAGL